MDCNKRETFKLCAHYCFSHNSREVPEKLIFCGDVSLSTLVFLTLLFCFKDSAQRAFPSNLHCAN